MAYIHTVKQYLSSLQKEYESALSGGQHTAELSYRPVLDAFFRSLAKDLTEDGSLDVAYINNLPVEERSKVVGSLTRRQMQEYLSKSPIADANDSPRSIRVNKPMEEWGVDALEFLNKMRESLK